MYKLFSNKSKNKGELVVKNDLKKSSSTIVAQSLIDKKIVSYSSPDFLKKHTSSQLKKINTIKTSSNDLPIFSTDYLTITRRRSYWNPITSGFTHTVSPEFSVMDIDPVSMSLKNAISFLKSSSKWEPYSIVFLGSNSNVADLAKVAAYKTNQSSVSGRWLAGLITNWNAAKHHLFEYVKLYNKLLSIYKELSIVSSKIELPQDSKYIKLEKDFDVKYKKWGGLLNLSRRPVLLVVLDVDSNLSAVNEAQRCGIPVIGLVHTHMNPSTVTYPIPCNTDSPAAVCTVINLITEAIRTNMKL